MTAAIVAGLYRHPIKGCRAVSVDVVDVTATGIAGDREQAIIDEEGHPLDQVRHPRLARIGVEILDDDHLRLSHPAAAPLVQRRAADGERVEVVATLDTASAIDQGPDAARWLSAVLQQPVRLVHVAEPWTRSLPLDQFALIDGRSFDRFASVAPILLNNQASLDDLNTRLDEPISMDRFRMNVVIDGLAAYEEDALTLLRGGQVVLERMTACERCVVITTDQRTGKRPSGQVLEVLRDYRYKAEDRYTNGLVFGAYMAVRHPGTLRVGEGLEVERDPDFVSLVSPPGGSSASG
ncbi:MAG: MOSC domain-containing protein [Acidimicrobiia bacterium]|nr:MOSC domain-containing protein [Acidimicrobiia bacterium]